MAILKLIQVKVKPSLAVLSSDGQFLYTRGWYIGGTRSVYRLFDGPALPALAADLQETDAQFCTNPRNPHEVRLICGTLRGSIKVWDIYTGAILKELKDPNLSSSPARKISIADSCAKGVRVASLDDGGLVRIWDVEAGACILRLGVGLNYQLFVDKWKDKLGEYYFIKISSDGSRLLIRRDDITAACVLH
jgi:WD40 repeat protein